MALMGEAVVSALFESVSDWTRYNINLVRDVEKEIGKLAQDLKRVRDFLYVVEERRGGYEGEIGERWMSLLERTSYEMEDVLDECHALLKLRTEDDHDHQSGEDAAAAAAAAAAALRQKVRSLIPSSSCMFCKRPTLRHGIARKIVDLKRKLDEAFKEKDRLKLAMLEGSRRVTSAPPSADMELVRGRDSDRPDILDLELVRGRDSDRDALVEKLVGRREELGIKVVSIVGIGGLGKTTLAQLVYNDIRVQESFDSRIWICVSDPFDLATIAKGILQSVGRGSSSNTDQLDVLLEDVKESISGIRFLLVLDDVWNQDFGKWLALESYLRYGGSGSKVLVTTRNRRVAEIMGTMDDDVHRLGKLSDEECWLLLCSEAFPGRNKEESEAEFKYPSSRIAGQKCGGLPLTAKVLGGLLRSSSRLNDWEKVLDTELWQLEEAAQVIFPRFLLSYNKFSTMHKRCFSYCAVLPKDSVIYVEDLIGNWMALGYLGSNRSDMELKGRDCFDFLASNSLFQDFEKDGEDEQIKSCKMPNIVHDFAQFVRKSNRIGVGSFNNTTCRTCDDALISTVDEFYSLIFVDSRGAPPSLCNCLKCVRVLGTPTYYRLQNFPQGLKQLIHLRWLKLDGNNLSLEDLQIIFKLYSLQTLLLRHCNLREIPSEIGDLIHLRRLDLSDNGDLEELPGSMGGLKELQTLNIQGCPRLIRLPEEMRGLINLRHLHNDLTFGVNGLCSLGLFENMNLLSGTLRFKIRYADYHLDDVIMTVQRARLRGKVHVERLVMKFEDEMEIEGESSTMGMHLMDALEPHPELESLEIRSFNGPNLPAWIASGDPKQLMKIRIISCNYISSLLPLAKLLWLEEIEISSMDRLQFLGREFLGITAANGGGEGDMDTIQAASSSVVAFPKLKTLTFHKCPNWRKWQDITAEEEESADLVLMPCLTRLTLELCPKLAELPRRLLRKVSPLEVLDLSDSEKLQQRYGEEIKWKSW